MTIDYQTKKAESKEVSHECQNIDFSVPQNPKISLKRLQMYRAIMLSILMGLLSDAFYNHYYGPDKDKIKWKFSTSMISFYSLHGVSYSVVSLVLSLVAPMLMKN